jgi:DNA-binding NarL/FixJ family response regulator
VSIRVVLVDDQNLVRAGFRSLLERSDDIEVVGEAPDGAAAVQMVLDEAPDVVLMDIRMPVMDGLEATRRILGDGGHQGTRVIVLTTFEQDEYVFEALRAGASGFLLKDVDPDDLRAAVRIVHGGDALLSPSVTRRIIERFSNRPEPTAVARDRLELLTEREREVVSLVGAGLNNDEIAGRLYMSPATSKTHVSRAMTKLGARDRAQLVVFAYETGLVDRGQGLPPA